MVKKVVIPFALKYDWAIRGYASLHRGYMYAIRKKYGAAAAMEIYESVIMMGDRIKRLTHSLINIFKIEGNDAEAIGTWFTIFHELNGTESTILEQSKTICRVKIHKCPWQTEPKDISDWFLPHQIQIAKTINPKASVERPKGMCAGDPYCEYVFKIEE